MAFVLQNRSNALQLAGQQTTATQAATFVGSQASAGSAMTLGGSRIIGAGTNIGSVLGSVDWGSLGIGGGGGGGGSIGAGGGGGGGGTPSTTPPPAPSVNVSQLLALASTIPLAQDGQIISVAHHNTMRSVLLGLIGALGGVSAPQTATISIPAALFSTSDAPSWVQHIGYATNPGAAQGATTINAAGWAPIELPHQSRIVSLNVLGVRTMAAGTLEFALVRLPQTSITAATTPPQATGIISVSGSASTNPFNNATNFVVSSTMTPSQIDDFTVVDNSKYEYLVLARVTSADVNAAIVIQGFQVSCS